MTISVSGSVITFSDSTTQSTAASTGGVSSLNGQTGAITNTSVGAIGSYVIGAYLGGGGSSTIGAGTTVSGSSLYQGSGTYYGPLAISNVNSSANNGFSLGLSGTWRSMNQMKNNPASPKNGVYGCYINLWVRIS
jgi:hypothetical protein